MTNPLLDRLTRRQVLIQRLSSGQVKKALPIIRQLARDLRGRIAAGDATDFQQNRLIVLERDIQALVAGAASDIQGVLDLEQFAADEVEFTQKLLQGAVSVDLAKGTSAELVKAVTTQRQVTLVSGDTITKLTIPQMFDRFSEAVGREAMRGVQAGVLEGKTVGDMARDVSTLVTTRSRRQAEAVIRTSVNGIGTAARSEVYKQNSDVLIGERFLAVLDSRTTITCASVESRNEIYPVGQGPMPPLHYGCRSIRVPEIDPEYRIGIKGERASYDGPVSNQMRYGGFLKRQSHEFQDEVLGKERAALFRSGKLKIDQFADDAGRVLSLDELRDKYDLIVE